MKVAAISFVPVKFDLAGNADRLEAAFCQSASGGAKLAVAPEGILEGYVVNAILAGEIPVTRMREIAVSIEGPHIKRFQALARALHLCLVFGFAERVGDDIFNAAVFIDDRGAICGKVHKMQFAEGYHPSWWFNRLGRRVRAFDTPFGRCGILICNDRWNASLARICALDGAQFLVIPAFGSTKTAQDVAVLDRSIETGLPIIEANVGVSLVVGGSQVIAVERAPTFVMFAEVDIPRKSRPDPEERDSIEREFLEWRATEMVRRYHIKKHRLSPEAATAAAK